MAEKKFVDGLRTFAPRGNAPEYVLGSLIITIDDFQNWVNTHPELLGEYQGKKQLSLDITTNKSDGRVNFAVNEYGLKNVTDTGITASQETKDRVAAAKEQKPAKQEYSKDDESGLPF
jgi:hypothetical protein